MKHFTDLFIRRPVLASVISLMILVLGLRAGFTLPILQYPRTQNAVVTVSTSYYGADERNNNRTGNIIAMPTSKGNDWTSDKIEALISHRTR